MPPSDVIVSDRDQGLSAAPPRASSSTRIGALKTAGWFIVFVAAFELSLLTLERMPQLAGSRLLSYFDYGLSVETKLRAGALTSQLTPRHIFNAGWLDLTRFPPEGETCDVAVYGMSFAQALTKAMHAQRPHLRFREFYGPGVPLSHSYTAYHMDAARRRARVVEIPLLSEGVAYLQAMTHDTLFPDFVQPVTWPRYALREGRAVMVREPAIRSADALREAVLHDPELWERHLATLADDDYFDRALYASHWTERSASLRLVRRALSHARAHELRAQLRTNDGFIDHSEAAALLRVLLRQYIGEVRANGELPIVVLFDAPGEPGWLQHLLQDVLVQSRVQVVRSQDFCDASHRENFEADGHYSAHCLGLIGAAFIQQVDLVLTEHAGP